MPSSTWWIASVLCVAAAGHCAVPQTDNGNNLWAVLVAGSHRWIRYRHQSNVCYAYKLLRENGLPKSRIITFMYDDIAYNENNPEPGVIRNEPEGENVYEGVPIDYSGQNVNKDVFLKVLEGRKSELRGIGSERVLASTKHENILIFHTGLGGHNGFVEFPDEGPDTFLYANELETIFKNLYNRKLYKNILMFLESSHSGAMFENSTIFQKINVLAMSAGGPDEDTWGTWCETDLPCLAGLYAYFWLRHAKNSTATTSVFDHYNTVRNSVANTGKEHPQLYGDWKIGHLPFDNFIGRRILGDSQGSNRKESLKNPFLGKTGNNVFDMDATIKKETAKVPIENKNTELKMKINNIIELVIPNNDIRNAIIRPENIITYEGSPNICFDNLLALFNKKCTNRDNNSEIRQEDINLLKYLCDATILNIQQMSAVEAIEKTCT